MLHGTLLLARLVPFERTSGAQQAAAVLSRARQHLNARRHRRHLADGSNQLSTHLQHVQQTADKSIRSLQA